MEAKETFVDALHAYGRGANNQSELLRAAEAVAANDDQVPKHVADDISALDRDDEQCGTFAEAAERVIAVLKVAA